MQIISILFLLVLPHWGKSLKNNTKGMNGTCLIILGDITVLFLYCLTDLQMNGMSNGVLQCITLANRVINRFSITRQKLINEYNDRTTVISFKRR